jgi:hypothetical protein
LVYVRGWNAAIIQHHFSAANACVAVARKSVATVLEEAGYDASEYSVDAADAGSDDDSGSSSRKSHVSKRKLKKLKKRQKDQEQLFARAAVELKASCFLDIFLAAVAMQIAYWSRNACKKAKYHHQCLTV